MTDRDEVLRQVLEIVDMFESENKLMARDNIKRMHHSRGELDEIMSDVEYHVAMRHAARLIGDAIRERFGLPKKEG